MVGKFLNDGGRIKNYPPIEEEDLRTMSNIFVEKIQLAYKMKSYLISFTILVKGAVKIFVI